MKTDLYTKVILTVIAIFLGVIIFQNITLVPSAQAAVAQIPEPKRAVKDTVIIGGIVDVNIRQLDGLALYVRQMKLTDGDVRSIFPVSFEHNALPYTLPVSFSSSSPIPVDITRVNGYDIGKISGNVPVQIFGAQ